MHEASFAAAPTAVGLAAAAVPASSPRTPPPPPPSSLSPRNAVPNGGNGHVSASPLASPRDRHTRKAPPPPPDSPRLGDASKYGSVDWPSAEAALASQLNLPPTLAWMARLALAPPAGWTAKGRAGLKLPVYREGSSGAESAVPPMLAHYRAMAEVAAAPWPPPDAVDGYVGNGWYRALVHVAFTAETPEEVSVVAGEELLVHGDDNPAEGGARRRMQAPSVWCPRPTSGSLILPSPRPPSRLRPSHHPRRRR